MKKVRFEEEDDVPNPSGTPFHNPIAVLVRKALLALRSKRGSSRKAITRYVCSRSLVKPYKARGVVARCLRRMLRSGHVYKTKRNLFKLTPKGRRTKYFGRRKKGSKTRRRRKGRKTRRRRRTSRRRRRRRGRKGRKRRRSRRRRRRTNKKRRSQRRRRRRRR